MTPTTLLEHYAVGAVLLLVLLIGASLTPAVAAPVAAVALDPVESTVFDYDPDTDPVLPADGTGDGEQPVTAEGRIMTTGDQIMGCDALRAYGITGTGVKIGVISNGLNGATAAQTSGDLGWVYTIRDEHRIGGSEGTAMLEIIHDIAPGATLYFHDSGNSPYGFIQAIDALVAAGCTVIVDDVGWSNQPYFYKGDIDNHLEQLLATQRLVYVTAAGNDGDRQHWQGPIQLDSDGLQVFSRTKSTSPYLYTIVPNGGTLDVFLQWDEPNGSARADFGIILFDSETLKPLAVSDRLGSLLLGESDPYELRPFDHLEYSNDDESGINHVVTITVRSISSTGGAQTLELFALPDYSLPDEVTSILPDNWVASDGIFGHPAVPDVITVAAVNADAPDTIEPFSSRGPSTYLFPTASVIQKPDISAPDYVNVTGYGRFHSPFRGTSAAAPHIAALCALVWSARPDLSPADIRSALYSSAVDLGTPGYDNVFGWGRADAVAMYNQLATGKPVNTEPPSVFRKFYPKGGPASGSIGGRIFRQDAGVAVPDSPIALPTTSPKKPPAQRFIRWYPGEN